MTDQPTPEKIKAFLDDLARTCAKHGVFIYTEDDGEGNMQIAPIVADPHWEFAGYSSNSSGVIWPEKSLMLNYRDRMLEQHIVVDHIESIDITQLSNHHKIEIMGGRT
jgi:hypothetical protein